MAIRLACFVAILLATADALAQNIVLPQPAPGAQRGRVRLHIGPFGGLHYRSRYGQGFRPGWIDVVKIGADFGRDYLGIGGGGGNADTEGAASPLQFPSAEVDAQESEKLQQACTSLASLNELRRQYGLPDKTSPHCAGGTPAPVPAPPPGSAPAPGQPLPPPGAGFQPVPTGAAYAAPAQSADLTLMQQYADRWMVEAKRQAEISIIAGRQGDARRAYEAGIAAQRASAYGRQYAASARSARQAAEAVMQAENEVYGGGAADALAAGGDGKQAPADVKQAPAQAPGKVQQAPAQAPAAAPAKVLQAPDKGGFEQLPTAAPKK